MWHQGKGITSHIEPFAKKGTFTKQEFYREEKGQGKKKESLKKEMTLHRGRANRRRGAPKTAFSTKEKPTPLGGR